MAKKTNAYVNEIGVKLVEWVKASPENIVISEFLADNNITKGELDTFLRRKDATDFQRNYQIAIQLIEAKLVKLVKDKSVSTAGVTFLLKNLAGYKDNIDVVRKEVALTDAEFKKIKSKFFPSGESEPEQEEEDE